MSEGNNKQFLNLDGVKKVLQSVKSYVDTEVTTLSDDVEGKYKTLSSDVNTNKGNISVNTINIAGEITRATNKEAEIEANVDKIGEDVSTLTTNLSTLDTKVDELNTDLNTRILEEIAAAKNELNTSISLVDEKVNTNKELINSVDASYKEAISTLQSQVNTQGSAITEIVNTFDGRVSDVETNVSGAQTNINVILNTEIPRLENSKLNSNGSGLELSGDLTIKKDEDQNHSGNLKVEGTLTSNKIVVNGDLQVGGSVINNSVIESETLSVKDNIIVVNSDGTETSNDDLLSGLAIRVDTSNTYGIVYNPGTESINLGLGEVDNNGIFKFNSNEGKPILIRDGSSNFNNDDILKWDSANKIAVSAGKSLDAITEDLNDSLTSKQDKEDNSLSTTSKTIVGAINENKSSIDGLSSSITTTQNTITAHTANKNNPHEVDWDDVKKDAFSTTITPSMNNGATGTIGESEKAARADHVHPVDTSRAPKSHTDTLGSYGKATTTQYGHVIIDDEIKNASENPVQNKVIKKYVDDEIDGLNSSFTGIIEGLNFSETLEASKTISTISQSNGKVSVVTQDIEIAQSQVTELETDISAINTSISDLDSDLTTLQNDLTAEGTARAEADTELGRRISSLENNIGNINLLDSNVKLSDTYKFTKPFGKYSPGDSGYVEVGRKQGGSGELMTLRELFLDAFQESSVGTIDYPSCTFSAGSESSGEIGDTYTRPTATFKVTDVGSYTYGPVTGIKFTSVKVAETTDNTYNNIATKDDGSEVSNIASDLVTNGTVSIQAHGKNSTEMYGDTARTYYFKAIYSYSEGAAPKTNLGDYDNSKKIPAVSDEPKTTYRKYNAGYRKMFMGISDTDATISNSNLTSSFVRGLSTVSEKAVAGDKTFTVSAGKKYFYVALPEKFTADFYYKPFSNWESFSTVESLGKIGVAGANNYTAATYNIYRGYSSTGKFESNTNIKVTVK